MVSGILKQTTLSDEEVIYEEQQGLYFLKYKIGGEDFLTIATTRPNYFGDTAIVLITNDERFAHLKGKSDCSYCGRVIPIIEDEYVDINLELVV
jgi:valyl-tRNA synthetase